MSQIVMGVLIGLLGRVNLVNARKQPGRISSEILRVIGWVAIVGGGFLALYGAFFYVVTHF